MKSEHNQMGGKKPIIEGRGNNNKNVYHRTLTLNGLLVPSRVAVTISQLQGRIHAVVKGRAVGRS